jgi:hypothetical protein
MMGIENSMNNLECQIDRISLKGIIFRRENFRRRIHETPKKADEKKLLRKLNFH